jgi:SAM-dependent methyltransferase
MTIDRDHCRACGTALTDPFLDLGPTPLANSFLRREDLHRPEPFYSLPVHGDYAYFSSFSSSWLKHAEEYVQAMASRRALGRQSLVIEIASNDGYLLQFFRKLGVPVLGIEPARNVATAAQAAGITTLMEFFDTALAQRLAAEGRQADLIVGNNVLAHVPDLNGFVRGLKIALKRGGLITLEFPHLLRLMAETQFDTIYHEHLSYFSLAVVSRLFAGHGLMVVDVDELPTHGGSLRVHACHEGDAASYPGDRVRALIAREEAFGLTQLSRYQAFAAQVQETKSDLLDFLVATRRKGASIVGYGAPAKGNTLLNYCGVRTDFIQYTVDRSPHKQGLFLPGTRIPIYAPDKIRETRPEYVLILPWNLKTEIMKEMADIRTWHGRFVIPVPRVEIHE